MVEYVPLYACSNSGSDGRFDMIAAGNGLVCSRFGL